MLDVKTKAFLSENVSVSPIGLDYGGNLTIRKQSKEKVLELEDIVKPFTCILKDGNEFIPRVGHVLSLQINGERRTFPIGQVVELDPVSYLHIMDIRFNGRDFVLEGSYDQFIIE